MKSRRYRHVPASRSASAGLNIESLEHRLLLAADWQNPLNPYDVDATGSDVEVTASDVLMIINELNAPKIADPVTFELPSLDDGATAGPPYLDVNGDGFVAAADAIQVINSLSADAGPSGNGDPFAPSNVMAGKRFGIQHVLATGTVFGTDEQRVSSCRGDIEDDFFVSCVSQRHAGSE